MKKTLSPLFSVAILTSCLSGFGADQFNWIPTEGKEAGLSGTDKTALEVKFTKIPKRTADKSKFTRKYLINLKKFSISNDGTHPVETSKGINAALRHAQETGANYVMFPPGTYLISEKDPVMISNQDMIIDLNGATLQINPNGQLKYTIAAITYGARNLRLTNGTLKGDRYAHDYKTVKGTHEWGHALTIESGSELEIDNMLFTETAGFSVASSKGMGKLRDYGFAGIPAKSVEPGGFSGTGEKAEKKNTCRTAKPYDISKFDGEFEFGYIFGYGSYASVFDRKFQAYFFGPDMKFIEMKNCLQFKKTPIPDKAKFIHLEFNQPSVEPAAKHGLIGSLSNLRGPVDVHFHHNRMFNNRSLGFAFCGGQRWIMEYNHFEKNGGTAPSFGIDFEDGWDMMQDIIFRKNTFKDNLAGDLVVCAGSEMIFEDNAFQKLVMVWPRTHNYTIRNNTFRGSHIGFGTRTGIASIHNNSYDGCQQVRVFFQSIGKNDGLGLKPGEVAPTPPLVLKNETFKNVKDITGTYIALLDCVLNNSTIQVKPETALVSLKGCTFENSKLDLRRKADIPVRIENCKGAPQELRPAAKKK